MSKKKSAAEPVEYIDSQAFDAAKIRPGVIKACEKRPVSLGQIDDLVRSVEKKV